MTPSGYRGVPADVAVPGRDHRLKKPAPANRAGEGYDLELGGAENRVGYTRDADIKMPAMAPHSKPWADTIVFYAT